MHREPFAIFRRECMAAGLDIVHPFQVQDFNATATHAERLPDFGRPALAALVGNSKQLWPRFIEALAVEPERRAVSNPLDSYVQDCVYRAIRATRIRVSVLWAHVTEPRVLPIQRIARAAGLAVISPSHFSIHPTYGPWLALRAVAIFDLDGPSKAPNLLDSPCDSCSQPCVPVLEDAVAVAERAGEPLTSAIRKDWQRWARVRQVCPLGQPHHYSEAQLEYHYTKNAELLMPPKARS